MGDNDAIGFVLVENSVNRAHQIEPVLSTKA